MDLPFYLAFPTGIYLFKVNNKDIKTLWEICPKLTRIVPDQMFETKLLQMCSFSLLSTLWIYHFHCFSVSFLPLYLSFHLDSLHRHPDSPQFLHFDSDSLHFHANALRSHSHPISHFHHNSPHFPHSVPQFLIFDFIDSLLSLQSLTIYFRKILALVQKHSPLLLLHNPHSKLLFTSSMTSSVSSPKTIYLIVSQVKNQ